MKKILLTSLSTLLLVGAANATEIRPYGALRLGYANIKGEETEKGDPTEKWDAIGGFTGAIAGGAAFELSPMVTARGELEYSFTSVKGKITSAHSHDVKITDNTILLNGFADFGGTQWGGFNPYVGLHFGYVFGSFGFDAPGYDSISANGLAYGASIGVAYAINSNIAVDLGFRYLMTNRSFDDDGYEGDFDTNQWSVMLGARYMF